MKNITFRIRSRINRNNFVDMTQEIAGSSWRVDWAEKNHNFIEASSMEDIFFKMFQDAKAAGISRIELPVSASKIASQVASNRCRDFVTCEIWGPYHFFVNIKI